MVLDLDDKTTRNHIGQLIHGAWLGRNLDENTPMGQRGLFRELDPAEQEKDIRQMRTLIAYIRDNPGFVPVLRRTMERFRAGQQKAWLN